MDENANKRPRRSRAEIDGHVKDWRASGESVRNFAEDRGIPASSFYQWIRARGGSRQGKKKSAKTPRRPQPLVEVETRPSADFAEVTVVDTARPRSEITVMTAAGHTITIEGEAIDPSILELVLGAVKAC